MFCAPRYTEPDILLTFAATLWLLLILVSVERSQLNQTVSLMMRNHAQQLVPAADKKLFLVSCVHYNGGGWREMWAGGCQQAVASHTFIVRHPVLHVSLFCRDFSHTDFSICLFFFCRALWMRHASPGTRAKRKCWPQLFFLLNVRPTTSLTSIFCPGWPCKPIWRLLLFISWRLL